MPDSWTKGVRLLIDSTRLGNCSANRFGQGYTSSPSCWRKAIEMLTADNKLRTREKGRL